MLKPTHARIGRMAIDAMRARREYEQLGVYVETGDIEKYTPAWTAYIAAQNAYDARWQLLVATVDALLDAEEEQS